MLYPASYKAMTRFDPANCLRSLLRHVLSLVFLVFFLLTRMPQSGADEIKMKILAVNPSDKNAIDSEVTSPLPPEVTPADVLDAAGLEVKFNADEKAYYLTGKVKLAPKESKTLTIVVNDVWKITPERIEEARKEITQKHASLQNTKFAETGELLYKKAMDTIDEIESEQAKIQGIRRRIEFYRASVQRLDEAQNNVLSIGALREMEAGGIEGRTAKFQITATNPAAEVRTMTVRADLPKEVQAEHVIDKAGFNLLFDSAKARFALEKNEEFQGKETKTFSIVVRDIWYIPPKEIEYIRTQTASLSKHFSTSNYADYAAGITSEIERFLGEIEALQAEVSDTASIQDRIRAFTLNSQKMNVVRGKVKELQDLLLELPLKSESDEDLVKALEGVRELQKIKDASKLLSMGLKPDFSTTWWIILTIIVFLMVLALIFYMTWMKKLQNDIYAAPPKSKKPDFEDTPASDPAKKT